MIAELFQPAESPEEYSEEQRNDSWHNSMKRELRFTAAYRYYLIRSLNSPDKAELIQSLKNAEATITEVMKANRGKFEKWQISAFRRTVSQPQSSQGCDADLPEEISSCSSRPPEEVKKAVALVERGFAACAKLKIRFQALVKSPLPNEDAIFRDADATVSQFRRQDLGFPKCSSEMEIMRVCAKAGFVGPARFILTKSPLNFHSVRNKFLSRGLSVKMDGIPSNCLITVKPISRIAAPTARQTVSQEKSRWRSNLITALTDNQPYWKQYLTSLSPAQRGKEIAGRKAAFQAIRATMTANGGKFDEWQTSAYFQAREFVMPSPVDSRKFIAALSAQYFKLPTELAEAITRVNVAFTACEKLKIHFQYLASNPLPANCQCLQSADREIARFQSMELGLRSFASLSALADFFRNEEVGAEAILTGGPENRNNAKSEIQQRGVYIQLEGVWGNRRARLMKKSDKRVEQLKDYKATRAESDKHLWKNKKQLLIPGGPAVYIEGNHTTLVRSLRRAGWKGGYSILQTADKKGWLVSVRSNNEKQVL